MSVRTSEELHEFEGRAQVVVESMGRLCFIALCFIVVAWAHSGAPSLDSDPDPRQQVEPGTATRKEA